MKGNRGILRIKTAVSSRNRTFLDDCYFEAPYKIVKPFAQDDGGIVIIVMSASAGFLENDVYDIDLHIGSRSKVTLTDQSYTKIFKMDRGEAVKNVRIAVEEEAVLRYLPLPTIPFEKSRYHSVTNIDVTRGGSLVYRDILSCGRLGSGEKFAFSKYHSELNLFSGGRRVLRENMLLEPGCDSLSGLGYYEGYTHQATLCFFGDVCPNRSEAAAYLEGLSDLEFGITETILGGVAIRMLGREAEQLEHACKAIETLAL